jgi:hypothetical protein
MIRRLARSRSRREWWSDRGLPAADVRAAALATLLASILVSGLAAPPPAAAQQTQLTLAVVDSLPLPPGRVTGLAWRGADTLAVLVVVPDSLTATGTEQVRLSLHDRSGALLHDADFSDSLRRGLAYDGGFYWACGDDEEGGSLIYKIEPDTLIVKEVYATPGHRPVGLAFDGSQIWISDRDSGRLDRFDPETGRVTRSALAPAFSPHGLAWDGRFMWVTDTATGRLYRLAGARLRWTGTVDTVSFLHRGEDVVLLHDGVWLWYVLPDADQAVRVRIE